MKPDDGEKGFLEHLWMKPKARSMIRPESSPATLRTQDQGRFLLRSNSRCRKLTLGTLGNGMPTLSGSSAEITFVGFVPFLAFRTRRLPHRIVGRGLGFGGKSAFNRVPPGRREVGQVLGSAIGVFSSYGSRVPMCHLPKWPVA